MPDETIVTTNDLVYSQTPQRPLRLDLRVPRNDRPVPLVMYIPVGGMRWCSKDWAPYWFTEHGFAVASIETRVSPEVVAPAIVHDCKAALRWLRANAEKYGYAADKIGAWGHSAGGLLAALLATSGDVPTIEGDGGTPGVSSRIQAACDECGSPHDLTYFARPEVKQRFPGVDGNIRIFLGAPVEERLELARLVSPRAYITPQCPPLLILHGDKDDVVPVEETVEFHKDLQAAGVDSTLRILPDTGHGWDVSLTRDDIVAFFKRTLGP